MPEITTILWPPNLLSHTTTLLTSYLERHFYLATIYEICRIFSSVSVYVTLWLNVIIKITNLNDKLQEAANSDAYKRISSVNKFLLKGYLHGYFLIPNLAGPIWVYQYMNTRHDNLEKLSNLYGFAIGVLHLPLLLSVSMKLFLPLVFSGLCTAVEKLSKVIWMVSAYIPRNPVAAIQSLLRVLRDFLHGLPHKIVRLLDRQILRSENRFLVAVMWFAVLVHGLLFYRMIVDIFRPHLQRLAIELVADGLMTLGDKVFELGMWVESLVVRRGLWEGKGSWEARLL
ncbi:uncharacterized protein CTRU02_214418 [Colletotrichum truncatum]|uniref:Uncharacterized protein n=1 Tax=Colletotrichum truncatum TaxID=5467 RepID=A0ACC3YER6_COLTU|nr:uncharacterized protein CTRU02_13477 [Colletotrichum truncatum]KAF6783241.1 hypothetical protein CTRU02_13477 [Colletotrichum truncatum]